MTGRRRPRRGTSDIPGAELGQLTCLILPHLPRALGAGPGPPRPVMRVRLQGAGAGGHCAFLEKRQSWIPCRSFQLLPKLSDSLQTVPARVPAVSLMLRAAPSHREEDHHASQCSGEHIVTGITSPKASWRDNDLNPLWKDSWAVGTSGGRAGSVTAGRAGSTGLSCRQLRRWVQKNGFLRRPAGLWSYTQNFRISSNHVSEALSRIPERHVSPSLPDTEGSATNGPQSLFLDTPSIGPLARSHCPTRVIAFCLQSLLRHLLLLILSASHGPANPALPSGSSPNPNAKAHLDGQISKCSPQSMTKSKQASSFSIVY